MSEKKNRKISARHPLWKLLEDKRHLMLEAVKEGANKVLRDRHLALAKSKPEYDEIENEVAAEKAFLEKADAFLATAPRDLKDRISITTHYSVDQKHGKSAAQVVSGIRKYADEFSALAEEARRFINAQSMAINDLFEAITLKISLADDAENVMKILSDAGISLPDIKPVSALPLELDESLQPGAIVTVNTREYHDHYDAE